MKVIESRQAGHDRYRKKNADISKNMAAMRRQVNIAALGGNFIVF